MPAAPAEVSTMSKCTLDQCRPPRSRLAPLLLPGARLVTMLQERLALFMRDELGLAIRLLEPPITLGQLTEVMLWTHRHDNDSGHRWLRHRMLALASEL